MFNPAPMPVNDLRAILGYDHETGRFWWKVLRGGPAQKGSPAGCWQRTGYLVIRILGKNYHAHRLAWYLIHEMWPPADIDHRNSIRNDNRIANLRLATRSQNRENTANRQPLSGYRGVSCHVTRHGKERWHAKTHINSRETYLGVFDTPKEAHEAVCSAIRKTRGEFARTD